MKPMRHRSPKTQNAFATNFFPSPKKKQVNIINIDNHENILNGNISGGKNYFNFNYNQNNYNYYEEITKAFNFITFVLKQKDNQIKELKIKISILEKQLNDINETNMMTFNNQDIMDITSNASNLKMLKNDKNFSNKISNNMNLLSPFSDKGKVKAEINDFWNHTQADMSNYNSNNVSNNNSNIINIYKNNFINDNKINNINNNKKIIDNNINIIHKIKNSTNINKINNYRNIPDIGKANINFNNNNNINDIPIPNMSNNNKQLNINTNEHSSDKKNINKIRRESYHSNKNLNVNVRNKKESIKQNKNIEQKNFTTDVENVEQDRVKILEFDNFTKPGSKSNSFNMSDDGSITSKNDVKNYLKEVKSKLDPERFKKFITQIKALTKNKNNDQKKVIILQIKNILVDKNLVSKFESIMKVKK